MRNPLLRKKQARQGIVKEGLVLNLDGRDFNNNPPTNMWMDRSLCNNYVYTNELQYNPNTWAEWNKDSGVIGDNTGLEFSTNGVSVVKAFLDTNLKPSAKYAIILDCVSNTLATGFVLDAYYTGASTTLVSAKAIGNIKLIFTTSSAISTNRFRVYANTETLGNKIKLKDIRVFELPTGSQIEWDFTNLTADQLNAKYSMQPKGQSGTMKYGNNAVPSNFGYIAPYADIISDFKGKVYQSIVENPNIMKISFNATSLKAPSEFPSANEVTTGSYGYMSSLDTVCYSRMENVNGYMAQQLFSFNLISIFERKYGEIPSTDKTPAGKVAWLKANLNTLKYNWTGYGGCPSGNKAYFRVWLPNISIWDSPASNISGSPTLLSVSFSMSIYAGNNTPIDSNGFVHFLANTDASDGVTASTIYTDYVSLTMSFKAASGSDEKGGVCFDGVDDSCAVNNLPIVNDFTISETITIPATTTEQHIIEFTGIQQYFSGTIIKFNIASGGYIDTGGIATSTKYRFDFTRNGDILKIYKNGVLVSTNAVSGAITPNLVIGRYNLGGYYYSGKFHNIEIYNRALTDAEILRNYYASR